MDFNFFIKKGIRSKISILILISSFTLSFLPFAFSKNPDVAPSVSIQSPQNNSIISGDALSVEVHFASKDQGMANVRYVKFDLDGSEVEIYQNPASIKEGSHIFQVDIASLATGEHSLQAFAYQGEIKAGLEGQSAIVTFTKGIPPPPFFEFAMVNPTGIFVNDPTVVAVTAKLNSYFDPSKVDLLDLDETGKVISVLGTLNDNGIDGDVIAGDNIYTLLLNLIEDQPVQFILKILAEFTTSDLVLSEAFFIDVIKPITEEEFGQILAIEEKANQKFEELKQSYVDDHARQLTVEWLQAQIGVQDAGISSDNDTIWILYESGLEGGILTHPVGTKGSQPLSDAGIAPSVITPRNSKAIILAPFFDQFSPNDESEYVSDKLSQIWGPSSIMKNSAVTVDLMKTIHKYGVVSISSHGGIDGKNQVQILTREKATFSNRLKHIFDLMTGRIGIIDGYYIVRPSFIRHYGGSEYPQSLIYTSTCSGLGNDTMASAFLDSGSYTYFGYDDTVHANFSFGAGKELFNYLVDDGLTTGEAFTGLGNRIDPLSPNAEFLMRGGDDLVLVSKPLIEILSPPEGGIILDAQSQIKAKIYTSGYETNPAAILIDKDSIVMKVTNYQGIEVVGTFSYDPNENASSIITTFFPDVALQVDDFDTININEGLYRVTLEAKDVEGRASDKAVWSFTALSAELSWVEMFDGLNKSYPTSSVSGSISASGDSNEYLGNGFVGVQGDIVGGWEINYTTAGAINLHTWGDGAASASIDSVADMGFSKKIGGSIYFNASSEVNGLPTASARADRYYNVSFHWGESTGGVKPRIWLKDNTLFKMDSNLIRNAIESDGTYSAQYVGVIFQYRSYDANFPVIRSYHWIGYSYVRDLVSGEVRTLGSLELLNNAVVNLSEELLTRYPGVDLSKVRLSDIRIQITSVWETIAGNGDFKSSSSSGNFNFDIDNVSILNAEINDILVK